MRVRNRSGVSRSGAIASSRQDARAAKTAARRDAILEAALDEFSARGFAAARLDDVAKRAGVAKGTIYLYFADKETLFQELIRAEIEPRGRHARAASRHADIPFRAVIEPGDRGVRPRDFRHAPQAMSSGWSSAKVRAFRPLAEFYYREVLSRVLKAMRAMLRRAHERGELKTDALVRFPHAARRAGYRRHRLERLVRSLRAARRARA